MLQKSHLLLSIIAILFYSQSSFGQAPDLGVTSTFALFTAAGAFSSEVGTSVVGDIGTNVGAFTPPGVLVGQIHVADAVSAQAAADVLIAYADLAGRTCGSGLGVTLGNGQVLTPNIYCTGAASTLNGDLTLDGQGNPDAIFIFQIDGAFSTTVNSRVLLTGGANLCNVYWQINGEVDLGENSVFRGTIVNEGAINLLAGATLFGRGLSTAGAISTNSNVVQLPSACFCSLTVTCPPANGGTFQCVSNIPVGIASDVTVVSSCGATSVSISNTSTGSGCPASPYVLTRTYTVTDENQNMATCTVTYTVTDNTIPVFTTCPAGSALGCNATGLPEPGGAIATDNCTGNPTITSSVGPITSTGCARAQSRTYTATDACNNTASCVQTFTWTVDVAPPVFTTCPAGSALGCNPTGLPAPAGAVATDNCTGSPTITSTDGPITSTGCTRTQSRTYTATDACNNTASCVQIFTWTVDVAPPSIICPVPVAVQCSSLVPANNPATVTASDACGAPIVTFVSDVITNQTCLNRFTLTRTYRATDACNNSSTCAQVISVFDNTVPAFVSPPANATVECLIIPPVATITATDNCSGAATVVFLGETQIAGICPVLYTLTRTWQATDACGNSSTVSQVLTVTDTNAPQFTHFPFDVVVECDILTNTDAFQDWLDSHGGGTAFDCSTITWTYVNSPFILDTTGCASTFQQYIRFIATDECGNSAYHDARFVVSDQTPPIFTVPPVNLEVECITDYNGEADLLTWLENFGSAQVSDACGSVATEIVFLSEKQKCGNTFTRLYQFRATDECGNTSYLTATFSVVDNTPPVIDTCPPNKIFLYCEFEVPPPDLAGIVASDNCGPITISAESFTVGVGCVYSPRTTIYTYSVTDECGNVSNCFQAYQVQDSFPPIYTGPDTLYVLCVADLPSAADVLGILAPYMVDNCYDVICFNDGLELSGANWVTFCVKAKDLCGNWTDKFLITFVATGGCKPICTAPQTIWANKQGLINGITTEEVITQYLSTHGGLTAGKLGKTITVSSADCLFNMLPGNGSTAPLNSGNYDFNTANGCQQSSLMLNENGTLKNALAANVLVLQLNMWYNQEHNSRDLSVQLLSTLPPCLIDPIVLSKVQVDFPNVQGLLYLSNDYLAGVGAFPPNFGNLMNTSLENINNYWLNCLLNDPCSTKVNVAGSLKTELLEGFEMGQVELNGSNYAGSMPSMFDVSDVSGYYKFSDAIPIFGNYSVTPSAEGQASNNGVTTYDLVLISKHIMGLEPLNSPYKMIAADANHSGSITTFDILELRKLILGIYDELPNNTPWRFIDKSFVFPDPANPFSTFFPENKKVISIQTSQMQEDFVSVKVGDVNGTAIANSFMTVGNRTEGTLLFDLKDRWITTGEILDIRMTANQLVQGYQFTLNTNGLEVLEISGKQMQESNFAVFAAEDALTTSWSVPDGTKAEMAEFNLTCRATQSGRLSEMISLSSRITRSEAYAGLLNTSGTLDVALRFHDEGTPSVNGVGFELYQNEPNPFVDKTFIGFHLPEATQATLKIFDETGKMVQTQNGDFDKGYNVFVVEYRLLKTTGVLYYQLETATNIATRRMIQVN